MDTRTRNMEKEEGKNVAEFMTKDNQKGRMKTMTADKAIQTTDYSVVADTQAWLSQVISHM